MKIAWLSDLNVKGSGYLNITLPICDRLQKSGHEVKVVGLEYKGEEHFFDFSIIPATNLKESMGVLQNLWFLWKFDVLVVALDVPIQEFILKTIPDKAFPYIGIMPIEADPLCVSWAMVLMQMDIPLIISKFGVSEAQKLGVDAEYLPIGIDITSWRPPTQEEREKVRASLGINKDTFVVLTVAENQERKNLSAAMEIVAKFSEDKDVKYLMVTRENASIGWKLRDYAQLLKISNKLSVFEKGVPFAELWMLYAASDLFLLTSKAEGLCTLPDTKVWTSNGSRRIDEISVGDFVVSHTGKLRKVTETYKRDYTGGIIELCPSYGLSPIRVTPEHRVLSSKKNKKLDGDGRLGGIGWNCAKELQSGDYVFYPETTHSEEADIDLSAYLNPDEFAIVQENKISSLGKNQFGKNFLHAVSKLLPKTLEVSPELMRLLGYYISEGCQTDNGLSFSFHSEETDLQQEVVQSISKLFNLDTKINYKDRHRCQMWVYHVQLGKVFGNMCGEGSHKKHIPEWALWASKENLSELLRAMFLGDGTYSKTGQRTMRYSTVSKELAEQLQFVLMRFGVFASLKTGKNRIEYTVTVHHQDLHKLPFYCQEIPEIKKKSSKRVDVNIDILNGFFVPIKFTKIWGYSGDVHNLEVEIDQSYLTSGGTIHNCLPALEAMATKLPVAGTDCTAVHELLEDGRGILLPPAFKYVDPFGNGHRYFVDVEKAVDKLNEFYCKRDEVTPIMTDKALDFVQARTWDITVESMQAALKKVEAKNENLGNV